MRLCRTCFCLLLLAGLVERAGAAAPWSPPVPAAAARYVEEALEQNLDLQTRTLEVADARARLAIARGARQPRLDLLARYSRASGGRTIDFPAGDLLNGVYRTLNEVLVAQGRPPEFPSLSNQSVPLLREREQETKIRLIQPLYRPELSGSVAAARAAAGSREARLAASRRELRRTVLTGYYTWLQTETAVEILTGAATVTAEARRTNQVLAEAGKVTEDRVLRAEAEELAVRQQRAEAERNRNAARSFFNFLLNRPLESEIERAPERELQQLADALIHGPEPELLATSGREELAALERQVQAAAAAEQAVRAGLRPAVALAVEGGLQGTGYHRRGGDDFVQGSLVAEWNLWDGRQRRSQLEQSRIARRRAELELETAREQLALELQQAHDDYRAAIAAFRAAGRRSEAAARAFAIVARREREGMVAQLSFFDARNERTQAELNAAIVRQRLLMAAVALDHAAALTPLP